MKESYFPDFWKNSSVGLVFKNFRERSTAKYYGPVILLSVVRKSSEKLVNERIFDHGKKYVFLLLISNMVFVLLDQLRIVRPLHLVELLGLLIGLGLLKL